MYDHPFPLSATNRSQNRIIRIGSYSYRKKDLLGSGYSSKVYKGKNIPKNEDVAIKIIQKETLSEQINKTLLQAELDILEDMKGCPNILHLHEVIDEENKIYIVTQLCQNDLQKKGKTKITEFIFEKYVKNIISGFKQLYQQGVIHRDLKPANLLVNKNSELKIADFGFAIKAKDARKQSKYNIGSPLYMAPETLARNQYSHKSDIWAIGVMLYEFLTGQTPWKAQTEDELIENLKNNKINSILENKKLPPSAKDLIQRALIYDKRFRMSESQLINFEYSAEGGLRQKRNIPQKSLYINTPNERKKIPSAVPMTTKNVKKDNIKQAFQGFRSRNEQNVKEHCNLTLKIEKLRKQEIKSITKMLIGQVHVCRMLYKIISKIKTSSKQGVLKKKLEEDKKKLIQCYANIIIKNIHKIKNFASNNFLYLPDHHLEEYVQTNDYKKLVQVCKDYIKKYETSQEISQFWLKSQQPNYQVSLKTTTNFLQSLWPSIKFINKEEIVLIEYLLFAKNILQLLRKGSYRNFMENTNIQEFIDQQFHVNRDSFKKLGGQMKQIFKSHEEKGKKSGLT